MRFAAIVLSIGLVGGAAQGDTIFDFEDGTAQGWTLNGTALHETFGVFGPGPAWAIFGTDGTVMSLTLDLTEISSVSWEQFTPWSATNEQFVFVILWPENLLDPTILSPSVSPSNPGRAHVNLDSFTGVHDVRLFWDALLVAPPGPSPEPVLCCTGFINEITFSTVPEASLPSFLVSCLGLSLLLAAIARRYESHVAEVAIADHRNRLVDRSEAVRIEIGVSSSPPVGARGGPDQVWSLGSRSSRVARSSRSRATV